MKTLKLKQWLAQILQAPLGRNSFDRIDESSEESFPASDSPAWAAGKAKDSRALQSTNTDNPITVLKEEHQVIMKMIYLIHEHVEQLQKNNKLETHQLMKIIKFMHAYVDKGHHLKEENYLFPALEKSGAPMGECQLEDFKQDHERGVSLVENLEKYTELYEKNDPKAREELIDILSQLKDIYTRHTLKEENFVFPLAEKYLSKGAQKTLFAQFEKVDLETGHL